MNLENPRCRRCHGERFLHVHAAPDLDARYEEPVLTWRSRPVRAVHNGTRAIGHFETLICRRCGFTDWYAFEWSPPPTAQSAPCPGCHQSRPHSLFPAVEHGGGKLEAVRITRGLVGREGLLHLLTCHGCGLARWSGRDYAHLEPRQLVGYRVEDDTKRPCLACRATDALIDNEVREFDQVDIPIALQAGSWWHRLLNLPKGAGHFELRLCRPCGSVEWYARDLAKVKIDPGRGVVEVGEREMSSMGGPYR